MSPTTEAPPTPVDVLACPISHLADAAMRARAASETVERMISDPVVLGDTRSVAITATIAQLASDRLGAVASSLRTLSDTRAIATPRSHQGGRGDERLVTTTTETIADRPGAIGAEITPEGVSTAAAGQAGILLALLGAFVVLVCMLSLCAPSSRGSATPPAIHGGAAAPAASVGAAAPRLISSRAK